MYVVDPDLNILSRFESLVDDVVNLYGETHIPLFHYTTPEGLRGIGSSGEIRMSNVNSMDDVYEIRYGMELVDSFLGDQYSVVDRRTKLSKILSRSLELLSNRDFQQHKNRIISSNFCFSLTKDGCSDFYFDSYGKQHTGYAIGFNNDLLQRINEITFMQLVDVVYDKTTQLELLLGYLCAYENILRGIDRVRQDRLKTLAVYLLQGLYYVSNSFKGSAYSEENEVRFRSTYINPGGHPLPDFVTLIDSDDRIIGGEKLSFRLGPLSRYVDCIRLGRRSHRARLSDAKLERGLSRAGFPLEIDRIRRMP